MRTYKVALVGATIYVNPTEDPIRDGVVLIEGGTIAAVGSSALAQIPPTAETLDCSEPISAPSTPDPSEEYALMTEGGNELSPDSRFADHWARRAIWRIKQPGPIAAGLQADLVVLRGDPSKNIRALAAVQYTLRAGRIIYRA